MFHVLYSETAEWVLYPDFVRYVWSLSFIYHNQLITPRTQTSLTLSLSLSLTLSFSLPICLLPLSLPADPLCYIFYPYRTVIENIAIVVQHLLGHLMRSIGERRLWVRFYFFKMVLFVYLDGLWDGRYYLPTPPLGQDMTQGQFLSGV